MREIHTIATLTVDRAELLDMAFSRGRLLATRYKMDKRTKRPVLDEEGRPVPNTAGAYNRVAAWLRREDPRGFDESLLLIGTDEDAWYLSYYKAGQLVRIMRDGRVRLENADPEDMQEDRYRSLRKVVDRVLVEELTRRLCGVVAVREKGVAKVTQVSAMSPDEGGGLARMSTVVSSVQG